MLTIIALVFFLLGTILSVYTKRFKLISVSLIIAYILLIVQPIWDFADLVLLFAILGFSIIGLIKIMRKDND